MPTRLQAHEVLVCTCYRCGHEWVAKIADLEGKLVNPASGF